MSLQAEFSQLATSPLVSQHSPLPRSLIFKFPNTNGPSEQRPASKGHSTVLTEAFDKSLTSNLSWAFNNVNLPMVYRQCPSLSVAMQCYPVLFLNSPLLPLQLRSRGKWDKICIMHPELTLKASPFGNGNFHGNLVEKVLRSPDSKKYKSTL